MMKSLLEGLWPWAIWILASLYAIAFIGNRPYLGLGIAVLGGVALGVTAIRSYESARQESSDRKRDSKL